MKYPKKIFPVILWIGLPWLIIYGQSPFSSKKNNLSDIRLRTFPYPFQAAFTIADDIDRQDWEDFLYIQDFYNRYDLEIGESFWMYHDTEVYPSPEIEFSYFEGITRKRSRFAADMVQYMRCGVFESLHTFEQTQPRESSNLTREDYQYAIEELRNRIGVRLKHWINHGDSPDKVGPSNMNIGDNPESKFYHTDFTNANKSAGYYSFEFYHTWFGSYDNPSYVLPEDVLDILVLDDGGLAYSYSRYHGVVDPPRSNELSVQMREENLQSLVENGGVTILYMHLGTMDLGPQPGGRRDPGYDEVYPPLDKAGEDRLAALSKYQKQGKIYVTTMTKLLQYLVAWERLDYSIHGSDIVIHAINDEVRGRYVPNWVDLQGITFYVPDPDNIRVFIGSKEVTGRLVQYASDGIGKSIGFPLIRITRPNDYPWLFPGIRTRIYTGDGRHHAVSYDRSMVNRLSPRRIKMKIELEYDSGELVVRPETVNENEILFTADGTIPSMKIVVYNDPKGFRIRNNKSYTLNRENVVLRTAKGTGGQVDFGLVPVGGVYRINLAK